MAYQTTKSFNVKETKTQTDVRSVRAHPEHTNTSTEYWLTNTLTSVSFLVCVCYTLRTVDNVDFSKISGQTILERSSVEYVLWNFTLSMVSTATLTGLMNHSVTPLDFIARLGQLRYRTEWRKGQLSRSRRRSRTRKGRRLHRRNPRTGNAPVRARQPWPVQPDSGFDSGKFDSVHFYTPRCWCV